MSTLCPKCGTVLECSIMFNNMFCPKCDHNEGAPDEQLENMRIERAKNRAEMHGMINVDIQAVEHDMCKCVDIVTAYNILILTNVTIDGNGVYQKICGICDKALDMPKVEY